MDSQNDEKPSSKKPFQKRMKILNQPTYDLVLSYKISPKNIVDKSQRNKIKSIAKTFDFVDDGTKEPWPKGKILYKLQFDKKGRRIGNSLIFSSHLRHF